MKNERIWYCTTFTKLIATGARFEVGEIKSGRFRNVTSNDKHAERERCYVVSCLPPITPLALWKFHLEVSATPFHSAIITW